MAVVGLAASGHGAAEPPEAFWVVTQTLNAAREAAGVYVHRYDDSRREVHPGAVRLAYPLFGGGAAAAQETAWLSSPGTAPVSAGFGAGAVELMGSGARPRCTLAPPQDRFVTAAALVSGEWGGLWAAVGGGGPHEKPSWAFADWAEGSAQVRTLRPRGRLPGTALAACALPDGSVAALCQTATGFSVEKIAAKGNGTVSAPITDEILPPSASSARIVHWRGGRVLALVPTVLERGLFVRACLVDCAEGALLAAASLPGQLYFEKPALWPAGPEGCWVLTYRPGTDFARLTRLVYSGGMLEAAAAYDILGAWEPVAVARHPVRGDLAVGAGNRIEFWPRGKPGGPQFELEHPVSALAWGRTGLLAGAANVLYHVLPDPRDVSVQAVFQTGRVTRIVAAPPRDAQETGVGPTPPNPALPPLVHVSEAQPARVLRPFALGKSGAADTPPTQWQTRFAGGAQPGWLRAGVQSAPGGPLLILRLVPLEREDASAEALLEIVAEGAPGGAPAWRRQVLVRRSSLETAPATRILWLLAHAPQAGAMPEGFSYVRDLLAAAPLHLSHEPATSVPGGGIWDYAAVVVDAAAMQRGVLTRTELAEYAAQGGSVLFLGGAGEWSSAGQPAGRLEPLGFRIEPESMIGGATLRGAAGGLTAHWEAFELRAASRIDTAGRLPLDAEVRFAGESEAPLAFAARTYRRGRVAVLAAPAPLTDAVLERPEHESARRFALDLFRWLARLGDVGPDGDGDGLVVAIEDRNGDGTVDPGETDPSWTDSDHDGIADGLEDRNANGRVDVGETSPIDADTDDDGVLDGADPAPLPAYGAPVLSFVEPGQAPAQGGMAVVLSGLNLSDLQGVWFGRQRSPRLEPISGEALVAIVPAAAGLEPGPVAIRIESAGGRFSLPSGFRYGPPSTVQVRAQARRAAFNANAGFLDLSLSCEDAIALGSVAVQIVSEPPRTIHWGDIRPVPGTSTSVPSLAAKPTGEGALWIRAGQSGRAMDLGEIARLPWRLVSPGAGPVQLRIAHCFVTSPHGIPLETAAQPAALNLPPKTP